MIRGTTERIWNEIQARATTKRSCRIVELFPELKIFINLWNLVSTQSPVHKTAIVAATAKMQGITEMDKNFPFIQEKEGSYSVLYFLIRKVSLGRVFRYPGVISVSIEAEEAFYIPRSNTTIGSAVTDNKISSVK